MAKRRSARHSLGKVERHKVEKWLARKLKQSLYSGRVEAAAALAEMLCVFQEKEE
jgi:hypothetical protein